MNMLLFISRCAALMGSLYFFAYCTLNRQADQDNVIASSFSAPLGADSTDVTAIVKAYHDKHSSSLPTNFRAGHVNARVPDLTKTTTADGYIIKTSHGSSIPTATVIGDQLYFSGGFGSKQYYAVKANTGEPTWAVDLDDDGPSAAAYSDGILVFNTESCTIFAIEASTGKHLWSYWLGDPLMSSPSIANGLVFSSYPLSGIQSGYGNESQNYIPNQHYNGNIEQKTHKEHKQQKEKHKEINATKEDKHALDTAKNNKKIEYVFAPSHALITFDLKTGKILWQRHLDSDIMSAPVAKDGLIYVTTFSGTLYIFKQESGDLISANALRATSSATIVDGEILLSKRADNPLANQKVSESMVVLGQKQMNVQKEYNKRDAPYLDANVQSKAKYKSEASSMDAGNGFGNGAPENSGWRKANENIGYSNVSSLQAFQGSRTLNSAGRNFSTMGNEMICNDAKSGKELWKVALQGDLKTEGGFMGTPPLSISEKEILVAGYTGEIMIFNVETGKEVKRYSTGKGIRYQPVVMNGWVYVTTIDGCIVAINTQNSAYTGWPMLGANAARTNERIR